VEKVKKSNKKWIIAIVLIIIIVIAAGLYFNVFSIPTGLIAGTETTGESTETETIEPPEFTVTGEEIIAKELTEALPYYESVDLESGRYVIDFISDEPVWMFVYNEVRFNQWKQGKYTFILAGTACCKDEYKTKSHTETFDVPRGEGGKVYIVVEGAEEASIKFKVTQTLKF